jgi:hypothetical protein
MMGMPWYNNACYSCHDCIVNNKSTEGWLLYTVPGIPCPRNSRPLLLPGTELFAGLGTFPTA